MHPTPLSRRRFLARLPVATAPFVLVPRRTNAAAPPKDGRYLYVASPGVRDYVEFGGHGLLVFDMDDGFRFVKRIRTAGLTDAGKPRNVKGLCASHVTQRAWISTPEKLHSLDLVTEQVLWERAYEGGCDRMALAPDGKTLYVPSFEKDHWHVVDALSGDVIKRINIQSGAHNTIYGLDGQRAYLAGLRSPLLRVADTSKHEIVLETGPFTKAIRPFTVNGRQTLCFVNVNELLGFEVGDLKTGKKLHRVEVQGFQRGPVKRHGCPSHGIGLTPDEKQVWVVDAFNQQLHVFDNWVFDPLLTPPKQIASIKVREEPGWVTFSLDGKWAFPSTGDIIEVATRKIVTSLTDEEKRPVMSEKMAEIHWRGGVPVRTGDQFGLGRVTA